MRLRASFKETVVLVIAVLEMASRSTAGTVVTVPPGLNPGDQYRLVFVTHESTYATSSNIADYNSFVTTSANTVTALQNLSASWLVIGSTATTNVVSNIGSSTAPIYDLSGNLVANGTAGLFSGSLLDAHGIDTFQDGSSAIPGYYAWSGSNADGTSFTGYTLGSARVWWGITGMNDATWISASQSVASSDYYHAYAISSVLTVPSSGTPEPTTISVTALGGAIFLLARRRKQQD